MTSSYEDIYSRFLQKCTDYDFIELDEETVYVDKEEAEESYRLYKHLE